MTKTLTTITAGLPVHDSSHTRTTVNVDDAGRRTVEVTNSSLSMRWLAGELRISHRFAKVPGHSAPAPARGARNRN